MKGEGYSIACLICGILSCVLCCICIGFPLGIAGIVLFILSASNSLELDIKAVFGLALSITGIILSIIILVFFIIYGKVKSMLPFTENNYYNECKYNDDMYPFDYYNLPYYFDGDTDIDEI